MSALDQHRLSDQCFTGALLFDGADAEDVLESLSQVLDMVIRLRRNLFNL